MLMLACAITSATSPSMPGLSRTLTSSTSRWVYPIPAASRIRAVCCGSRGTKWTPDHQTTSEHSDRGCGEADSAVDTGHRTEAKSSDPTGPESSIDRLERGAMVFQEGQ